MKVWENSSWRSAKTLTQFKKKKKANGVVSFGTYAHAH